MRVIHVPHPGISALQPRSFLSVRGLSSSYLNACLLPNRFSEQTTDLFETNGGTNPAYTFLTGHGGFLQYAIRPPWCCPRLPNHPCRSLTHGFTGYRSRTNAFYLDPILPIQLENYTVKGMKWLDSTFDVTLSTKETIITRRKGTTSTAPVEIGPSNAKAGNQCV
jgi:hypothetical protein